jgi:hypothetical protein
MSARVLSANSPIERNSVANQAAKQILDLVRSGDLKPGVTARITQMALRAL